MQALLGGLSLTVLDLGSSLIHSKAEADNVFQFLPSGVESPLNSNRTHRVETEMPHMPLASDITTRPGGHTFTLSCISLFRAIVTYYFYYW